MTNGHLPPEYRVSCVMCNQSFSATADTLAELVDIVALHLRRAEAKDYEPHQAYNAYLKDHADEKEELETFLAKYRLDKSEIVRSKLFRWDILRLVPYVRIFEEVAIPLPSGEVSEAADEKGTIEE